MSWLVENYIINKESIKSSADINSDEYMDILIIEKLIKRLNKNGVINNKEMRVLDLMSQGYTIDDISREFHANRVTISAVFNFVCEKIAFILGGYFTDDGFLEYMKEKYEFDIDTMEKISRFLHSSKKHRIKRTNFLFEKENNK